MSYSEFTIKDIRNKLHLKIIEEVELFLNVQPVKPSSLLLDILTENIPLALRIDTEKARSEMIVAPVLIELRKLFNRQISLFSGTEFNVDKSQGLNGTCDFIISHSPEQLSVTVPIATMVEAKNDNIKLGIPQCIAEMVAAQMFNQQENNHIPFIYGVVTTGSIWKFLKLTGSNVYLNPKEHFIENLELLFGILSQIIDETRPNVVGNGD